METDHMSDASAYPIDEKVVRVVQTGPSFEFWNQSVHSNDLGICELVTINQVGYFMVFSYQ